MMCYYLNVQFRGKKVNVATDAVPKFSVDYFVIFTGWSGINYDE